MAAAGSTHDSDVRAARIGQVLDEVCSRRAAGERLTDDEILARFPDLVDALRPQLALLRSIGKARGSPLAIAEELLGPPDAEGFRGTLGPYRLAGVCGGGGMGIVLKAYDSALQRWAALKILRPDLASDGRALARFTREARAAAALQHPHIVSIYGFGEERGLRYIAMEYVEGPSLADFLREHGAAGPAAAAPDAAESSPPPRKGLPAGLAQALFRQLMAALAAAHAAGLIHRDVKPANILLSRGADAGPTPRGPATPAEPASPAPAGLGITLKLADFGLARLQQAATQLTLEHAVVGTPEYMSPEQCSGATEIDHRTDLYSAGVVLFELLTGTTPFHAPTPSATMNNILAAQPPDPRTRQADAPSQLAHLAVRLMAKQPADRIESAVAVLEILDRGSSVPEARPVRKRRLQRAAIAVALLALAAGAWLFISAGHARPAAEVQPPCITRARASADWTELLVNIGDSAVERRLLWLQELGYAGGYSAPPALADLANGRQVVLVCCRDPLDETGATLIAFNGWGQELWRWAPMPEPNWPDSESVSNWVPTRALAGDLDGQPGDEFLVAACHPYLYPTRLTVLDPATGAQRATLWHCGHLAPLIAPDYFKPGHAAIIASGVNNKLDGFYDGLHGPERQWVAWDLVYVAMVIDPARMDGWAPPTMDPQRMTALGWEYAPVAPLWAYACLDRPSDPGVPRTLPDGMTRDWNWRRSRPEVFSARIAEIRTGPTLAVADLNVLLALAPDDADGIHEPSLHLDRHLGLLQISEAPIGAHGKLGTNTEFWRPFWRVIMRDGRYTDE